MKNNHKRAVMVGGQLIGPGEEIPEAMRENRAVKKMFGGSKKPAAEQAKQSAQGDSAPKVSSPKPASPPAKG